MRLIMLKNELNKVKLSVKFYSVGEFFQKQ